MVIGCITIPILKTHEIKTRRGRLEGSLRNGSRPSLLSLTVDVQPGVGASKHCDTSPSVTEGVGQGSFTLVQSSIENANDQSAGM